VLSAANGGALPDGRDFEDVPGHPFRFCLFADAPVALATLVFALMLPAKQPARRSSATPETDYSP